MPRKTRSRAGRGELNTWPDLVSLTTSYVCDSGQLTKTPYASVSPYTKRR